MELNDRAAKNATVIYRFCTVAGLVLTFFLFIAGTGDLVRSTIFLVWFALMGIGCFRIFADLVSGQHLKEQNFGRLLVSWEQQMGSRKEAVRTLVITLGAGGVLKLAVPFVLWFVLRQS